MNFQKKNDYIEPFHSRVTQWLGLNKLKKGAKTNRFWLGRD